MTARVAVLGATGRMGRQVLSRAIDDSDLELVAAITAPGAPELGQDVGSLLGRPQTGVLVRTLSADRFDGVDVVIDFSLPAALRQALPLLGTAALVTGTTGLSEADQQALLAHADQAALLQASNFSTGVNLLLDLVARAARALPEADIEVIEAHHRRKVDAPSGTALALAQAAAEARGQSLRDCAVHGRSGAVGARPNGEIGIHAIRGGDVVGHHEVWLVSDGERLELNHVASNRGTFAQGALRAARWIHSKGPGQYTMRHVLGLEG